MYKRLIILSAIILAAVCGLAWLGYHSVQIWARGMEGERLGQFAEVAEDIRQDVDRKLEEFRKREENRPYTDYQHYYIPDNTVAGQIQMPLLRSPLAGKISQGLAYGQFQIEPDGRVVTPNDDLRNMDDIDLDSTLYTQVKYNRRNVEDNVLPALAQVTTGPLDVELQENIKALLKEAQNYDEIQAAAIRKGQKQTSKSKLSQGFQGKNLPIESFQNPKQQTQYINRSRAVIEQMFVSNSATPEGGGVQMPTVNLQTELADSVQIDSFEEAETDRLAKKVDDYDVVARSTPAKDEEVSDEKLDADRTQGKRLKQKKEDSPASGVQSETRRQSVVGRDRQEPATMNEKAEPVLRSVDSSEPTTQPVADYRMQTTSEATGAPAPAAPPQHRQSSDKATPQQGQAGNAIQTQPQPAQQGPDMVQVRIEPFVPLMAPCNEGEESIFGGQVFMIRHVQIEDKHFIQGFQLDEKELIAEVEESAQKFMREDMGFELAKQANGGSAYTAILDFGFGKLILNLLETDPHRIATKISGMRTWYFSIITVVLLAVTLGLASLWHNARAQLRLARKKDDFISAVSHELRTPLTSIRMYSEMLEKNWVKSRDKVVEYYRNMRQESERLSRLIENVLDFSRIQRGRKRYNFNLGDINNCIADVVEMMRPYAAQNGFAIEAQLGELGQAAFDGDAVTQIVVNLLDNAIKYARNADDKTVTVRTRLDRRFITIEVEDHGPGIPHRQRKRIFEEFYRIGSESTRETTGTGLGLALVKRFAQAHDGFVEILNARPKGTIFRVALAAQA